MPRGYPWSTPGVDFRSQEVIPRQFKQKKIFVTDGRTHVHESTLAGGSEEFLRWGFVHILLQRFLFSGIPQFVGFPRCF